jgi:DNA-binding NarL/FixJ family response regulator
MEMVRILIADDHEGKRGVLRVLLQDHPGWTICGEVSFNSEVLQKSLELKPDVLVKDWVMPGVSNLEVTREIARRLPETPIVLFSFHDHLNWRPSPRLLVFTAWLPRICQR